MTVGFALRAVLTAARLLMAPLAACATETTAGIPGIRPARFIIALAVFDEFTADPGGA